jgi:hypothetical protein
MTLVCENRLAFLSRQHKLTLNKHFEKPFQTAQACEIAIKLGIKYSEAITILLALGNKQMCVNWSLLYHTCSEAVVEKKPFSEGMPLLPYTCPYCEEVIYTYDELEIDLMAESKDKIDFI